MWVPANPPRPELPELPSLGGDLIGEIKDNRIAQLQGQKVAAEAPRKGDVLTFDGDAWVPAAAQAAAAHGPVEVVAAGVAQLLISSGQFKSGSAGGAPKVEVRGGSADGRVARIGLVVRDIPKDEHLNHRITVLLTPIVDDPKNAVVACLAKPAVAEGLDIHFEIMLMGLPELADGQHTVQFQVSRFAVARTA